MADDPVAGQVRADLAAADLESGARFINPFAIAAEGDRIFAQPPYRIPRAATWLPLSVTEGDDKPLKYLHMFRAAELMILNKIDLLPHVDFNLARAIEGARQVNPGIAIIQLSVRTGEGLDACYEWLDHEIAAARENAFN